MAASQPAASSLLIADFLLGRKMLLIQGTRALRPAGLIRAIFSLLRMYWFGYSNTQFLNPDCTVKTLHENREMCKNRAAKSVMIFEVEL